MLNDISNYYFCILLPFWHRDAASDINGLKDMLYQKRNCNPSSGIEEMMIEGKELAEKMGLDEPRMRQKKMMSGEETRDAGLTENLKRKMKACIDRFLSESEGFAD